MLSYLTSIITATFGWEHHILDAYCSVLNGYNKITTDSRRIYGKGIYSGRKR